MNPVWNEEKTFPINQPLETVGKIRFEVFDSDMVGAVSGGIGDPTLGFIDVDWPFWDPKDTEGSFRAPVSLNLKSTAEKGKTTVTGQLKCDLVWCPAGSTPRVESKESIPIAQ